MNESDRRFWPFKPRTSFVATIVLWGGLLLMLAILQATVGWPSEKIEGSVLIGVFLSGLLPVLLALVDVFIERGGVIEYGGVKIDFSKVPQMGASGFTVPVNIGFRGAPVTDSSTTQILDALKQATTCDAVIIDLEEGQAWWETRLLVLLAGAERLKKPEKIVFVGTDGRKEQCFQGWAHPNDLLPCLVQAHPQYLRSLYTARAAARQWEMVEPVNPVLPGSPPARPGQPPWMSGALATRHAWMAFDGATGLPNEHLAEQLLASELGEKVESQEEPRKISLVRLDELFRPVLSKDSIDQGWSTDRQVSTFLDTDAAYIAVTQNDKYLTLVSRLTVFNEILRSVVEKEHG